MLRPVIGIMPKLDRENGRAAVSRTTMDALLDAGALPVLLPPASGGDTVASIVDRFDGFLFPGGVDVGPSLYGEETKACCGEIDPERDALEAAATRLLAERTDKPVLAICRGVQLLCAALGGSLCQDIPHHFGDRAIAHWQKEPFAYPAHRVTMTEGTLLHSVLGASEVRVNSLHHQAVLTTGRMSACAFAPDGIIEAAELPGHPFFLGVQWHPELMWREDAFARRIFDAFVKACRQSGTVR